jgi:predicted short-subunit dehydrogenase-like oxidoreductase (DUF2520 family)
MTLAGGGVALWIVGAGRLGLAMGLALHRAGAARSLAYAGRAAAPPAHPLFSGTPPPASYATTDSLPPTACDGVVIAVPDDALASVATRLAARPLPAGVPVLHTCGSRGSEVLSALAAAGHPVGSLHPLAAVADPVGGTDRLRGAWWGVEGEGPARALAERIVAGCGGRALAVEPGGKPAYHAAAVLAANCTVALLSLAEGVMARAGVPADDARAALAALSAGAVENVAAAGPERALTGPVARGDAETVALNLSRLSAGERGVYSLLGREALRLARAGGLEDAAARRVGRLLGEGE